MNDFTVVECKIWKNIATAIVSKWVQCKMMIVVERWWCSSNCRTIVSWRIRTHVIINNLFAARGGGGGGTRITELWCRYAIVPAWRGTWWCCFCLPVLFRTRCYGSLFIYFGYGDVYCADVSQGTNIHHLTCDSCTWWRTGVWWSSLLTRCCCIFSCRFHFLVVLTMRVLTSHEGD